VARAEDLAEGDRARLTETVVGIHKVIHTRVRAYLAQIEEHGASHLDQRETQALHNLQRTAQGLLDQHPGLLQLRKPEGGQDAAAEAVQLDELLKALDLEIPEG
jgi:anti-sigma factor ChrR (cupin superfamily)